MSLLIKKHCHDDFLIADVFDNLPFKNDLASMEHPVFTLSLKPDKRTLVYKNGNAEVTVTPSIEGLPSIMDKDFLMYCGSLLLANLNAGRKEDPEYCPPRTIRVSAHDYFKATQREDNGKSYEIFKKTLLRLRSCTITTTIKTNGKKQLRGFGLIESYQVIESCKVKNRMVALEVTLSDWYYQSILGLEVLSLNRNYFLIRKPLERRLYEIAKKHCGNQKLWFIKLENLFIKTGSSGSLAKFRFNLKKSILDNHIPDYQYSLDDKDIVTIKNKNWKKAAKIPELKDKTHVLLSQLNEQTIINAQKIHENSFTDWELKEIAVQFYEFTQKKGMPNDINKAFIGFLKKKVTTYKKDSINA